MPRPKFWGASRALEAHAMSLIRSGSTVTRRWGLPGVLLAALVALPLFNPTVATAQDVKQIRLTEKQVQGFVAVSEPMARIYEGANPDKPDPKRDAQAEALVKKNGFSGLAEYDDVSMNIGMIMSGIDPETKKFTEPPDQIKNMIASIKADKSIPEAKKKEELTQLEAELKGAKPVQYKENIALVLKYFDKLPALKPDDGPAD
jgi:hypothetical protein